MAGFRQSQIKPQLMIRSDMNRAIREWFYVSGFMEVATPVRVAEPAPEDHIDPVESDGLFLQTSPELCMKRLLASGYGNIYQIATCFRSGERGHRHLPEMTLLEWYRPGADYLDLMADCEDLFRFSAGAMGRGDTIRFDKHQIDLSAPWERLTVEEAFHRYGSMPVEKAMADGLFDEVMGFEIEPQLGLKKPCFLMDYPAEMAALAKRKDKNEDVAERFELYMAGLELGNAFSELTDPVEQNSRFTQTLSFRQSEGKKSLPMPSLFLSALSDMPTSAGIALGLDRMAMLFSGSVCIDNVVAFTPEELGG